MLLAVKGQIVRLTITAPNGLEDMIVDLRRGIFESLF